MSRKSFPYKTTGGALRDLEQPGYYAGYSTLGQKSHWDAATRDAVVERAEKTPAIRFFSPREAAVLEAVAERILPQDDRAEQRTIPILPALDERLYTKSIGGFRYEGMPPDETAYRLAIEAIDAMAVERFGEQFIGLSVFKQELILKSLHDGKPDPAHPVWQRMPVNRFWAMLLEDCVTAYYAHPWAWDEIGYGGPAYPRGYMRLENGLPEPWEEEEQRYDWNAPADSLSELDPAGAPPEHESLGGHGGSH